MAIKIAHHLTSQFEKVVGIATHKPQSKDFSINLRPRFQSLAQLGTVLMVVIWLWLLLSMQMSAGSPNLAQGGQEARPLAPGQTIERELRGGEIHSYQLTLAAGQYLRIVVEQRGVDALVTLFGPDGQLLVQADSFRRGVESIPLIAPVSGNYRLAVQQTVKQMATGRYQVSVHNLRAATPEDQTRTIAEQTANQLLIEGRQLAENKPEDEKKPEDNLRKAVATYQAALQLWQTAGNQRGAAAALMRLGVIHSNLNERPKALEYYKHALPLWQAAGDRMMEGSTLANIGLEYLIILQFQTGLSYLERALPLVREGDDRALEATTFTSICGAHILSDQPKALECLDQARVLWQASEEPFGEAQALNLTGVAYRLLGERELSDHYLTQANQLLRAGAAPPGSLTPRERDRVAAGQVFSQAALLNAQGTCREAILKYEEALKLWRAAPDRVMEATILAAIGSCWFSLGGRQQALDSFNQALAIWRELENQYGEALVLSFISEVYDSSGERQQAREHLDQALRLWREKGDQLEADLFYLNARVKRGEGRLAEAQAQIEAALNLIETLRAKLFAPERRTSLLSSKHAYYEFYIDLLMQRHRGEPSAGYHAAALEVSERARARSLLDLLAEARADIRQGADSELLKRERSLQRQLYAKERSRIEKLRGQPTPEQLKPVNQEIAALLQQYQELGAQMRRNSPRYAALTRPQPLSLPEIQQQVLDKDALLLEYALGETRSYLWAVTKNSINSFELPRRDEIEAAALRVYQLLTERNQCRDNKTDRQKELRLAEADARYVEAAARLSRMLLGPVTAQLGGKRLLIVADGALQYLPFAALPAPQSGGAVELKSGRNKAGHPPTAIRHPPSFTPLILNHEIISLPSASTMAITRRELDGRQRAPKALAVLAAPVTGKNDERTSQRAPRMSNPSMTTRKRGLTCQTDAKTEEWDRLLYSELEANQITSFLPPEQTLKAIGFQANRTLAMSDKLSQYRIVHFSTHGKADSERPELSTLVLSLVNERGEPQDGYLRAHEIFNLKLPVELVVLSACETGLGKNVRGEGLISLTRGFMYAGAKRVVVSLWSVNDASTADLMVKFYRAMLKDGLRPAAALRRAQIEMWKSKRLSAPFFWAGFVLQGEWR